MTQPLPPLPSRGRTYGLLAAAVSTLLTLAVVLPLALGDRPDTGAGPSTLGGPLGVLPTGGPTAAPLGTATTGPTAGPSAVPGTSAAPRVTTAPTSASAPLASGVVPPPAPRPGQPAEPRRASDQGLTASTVRLGVFLVDLGGASDLGATVPGYDVPSQMRLANAYKDAVNRKGGIGGRRLELVFRKVDITDQQTAFDACTSFGETDKVFAVAQALGVYGEPILKCAVDERLPFLSNDGAVSSYYPAAKGYLVTTQPSTLRTLLNMEDVLFRLGELKGKKVGVLYEDGYLTSDSKALVKRLAQHGITAVEGSLSSSDVTLALRQVPVVAQDFCRKGVDYVLIAVNELYTDQFHTNVERYQGCRPAYAVSDFDFAMNGDAFLDGQNDSFFGRVLAVSAGRVGEGRVGIAEPALDASCRKDYATSTGIALDRNAADGSYFNAIAVCGVVRLLQQGMEAAGTNPTRAGFVAAVGRLGSFGNPGYGTSSFTPSRYDAPEVVRVSRGFLDCHCWKPQNAFSAATYR